MNTTSNVWFRKRMSFKRVFKFLKVVSIVVISLVVLLLIGIHSYLKTEHAQTAIAHRISNSIQGTIGWDELDIDLFSGRLGVKQLFLTDANDEPIITAKRASIDVGLKKLTQLQIYIQTVHLEQPQLDLAYGQSGDLNILKAVRPTETESPKAPSETKGPPPFNILVRSLEINDGQLHFLMPAQETDRSRQYVALEKIAIQLTDANLLDRSGKLQMEVGNGELDMAGIKTELGKLRLDAILRDGRLKPLEFNLETKKMKTRLSGAIANVFEKPELDLEIDSSCHLEEIRAMLDLKTEMTGPLQIAMTLQGGVGDPQATLSALYGGGRVAGIAVDSTSLKSHLKEQRIEIDPLTVAAFQGEINITGTLDLANAFPDSLLAGPSDLDAISYRLDLQTESIGPGSLPGTGGLLGGNLKSHIALDGRGIFPGRLSVDTETKMTARDFEVAGIFAPTEVELSTTAKMEAGKVSIANLDLATGSARIGLSGDCRVFEEDSHKLHSAMPAEFTAIFQNIEPSEFLPELPLEGRIDGEMLLAGNLAAPRIEFSGDAAELALPGIRIGDLATRMELEDGTLELQKMRLENAQSVLEIGGTAAILQPDRLVPLSDPKLDLEIRGDSIAVNDFVDAYSGKACVNGKIGGTLGSLRGFVNAEIADLDLEFLQLQKIEVASRIRDDKISFDPVLLTLTPEDEIRATGWVSQERQYEIEAEFKETDLEPYFRRAGRSGLSGQISGTVAAQGDLTAIEKSEVRAEIDRLEVDTEETELLAARDLRAINGNIRFNGQSIRVEQLAGRIDKGRFKLNGVVELEDMQPGPAHFELHAQRMPIEVPDMLNALVDADLVFDGTPDKAGLTGSIVLLEGLYYKDVKLDILNRAAEFGRRGRETQPEPPQKKSYDIPYLRNLKLDIDASGRDSFLVDNNLALLSLKPELRIHGTLSQPLLSGRAEIAKGAVSYRKNEFKVERGVVDFTNPYRIEPTVDIVVTTKIRDWNIMLTVTGPLDELEFTFTSSPPLENADIVSLLVTGKTNQEFGKGSAEAAPEQMLIQVLADRLSEGVKSAMALDMFEVDYQYKKSQDKEVGPNVEVTVGKELSRRLTVKQGIEQKSGERIQKRSATYKLLDDIDVNASQQSDQAFGWELRYRKEFR